MTPLMTLKNPNNSNKPNNPNNPNNSNNAKKNTCGEERGPFGLARGDANPPACFDGVTGG